MDIDELLNKYFEGETTAEEESRLRTFFTTGHTPARLEAYKPLFVYFDREISRSRMKETRRPRHVRRIAYIISGVAACILLFVGVRRELLLSDAEELCLCSPNYVIINGRCYTDTQKAHTLAFEALREVATDDVSFPAIGPSGYEE
ncbi:MAG: hypothetical protein LBJ58_05065 [Tannerellaceae bacterium]|jgi:hypothetical protein|nr:hypothetical protein [Tannerellaceae bacterium]